MNERMTKRDTDGQAMMDCEKCKADWTGKHGKPMADCTALYCRNHLLDLLVEYGTRDGHRKCCISWAKMLGICGISRRLQKV